MLCMRRRSQVARLPSPPPRQHPTALSLHATSPATRALPSLSHHPLASAPACPPHAPHTPPHRHRLAQRCPRLPAQPRKSPRGSPSSLSTLAHQHHPRRCTSFTAPASPPASQSSRAGSTRKAGCCMSFAHVVSPALLAACVRGFCARLRGCLCAVVRRLQAGSCSARSSASLQHTPGALRPACVACLRLSACALARPGSPARRAVSAVLLRARLLMWRSPGRVLSRFGALDSVLLPGVALAFWLCAVRSLRCCLGWRGWDRAAGLASRRCCCVCSARCWMQAGSFTGVACIMDGRPLQVFACALASVSACLLCMHALVRVSGCRRCPPTRQAPCLCQERGCRVPSGVRVVFLLVCALLLRALACLLLLLLLLSSHLAQAC